tara:strand:- start:42 stop:380 length:339 start_codon:yes stop_codon:yes gene_type:complete
MQVQVIVSQTLEGEVSTYVCKNNHVANLWYIDQTLESAREYLNGYEYDEEDPEFGKLQQLIEDLETGHYDGVARMAWDAWMVLCDIIKDDQPEGLEIECYRATVLEDWQVSK